MAMVDAQDQCLDWLFASPVAMYISETDLSPDSTMPRAEGPLSKKTMAQPVRHYWASETQYQSWQSNSSHTSAPGMVVDVDAPSPDFLCEGDDHEYRGPSDVIWDSWLEDNSLDDPQCHIDDEMHLPLRIQRSNLTLPKISLRSALTKMRSLGDLRVSRGITPIEYRNRTCALAPSSQLHALPYRELHTRHLHNDTRSDGPHRTGVSPEPISRLPFDLQNGTLLEPRPQRVIPSINSSLYSPPPPSEWLSQNGRALTPPSLGEKSVFEDWDEPKATFWRWNRKRKRRSTSDSGSDGNGRSKSSRKRGGKLWNLSLLAMPGML
jgi:hypothetical protein